METIAAMNLGKFTSVVCYPAIPQDLFGGVLFLLDNPHNQPL